MRRRMSEDGYRVIQDYLEHKSVANLSDSRFRLEGLSVGNILGTLLIGLMPTALCGCAGPPDEVTAACDRDDHGALLRLAERGEPIARLCLGIMYEGGKGVSRDLGEAAKWYRLASE
jgi:TPR repeat protein